MAWRTRRNSIKGGYWYFGEVLFTTIKLLSNHDESRSTHEDHIRRRMDICTYDLLKIECRNRFRTCKANSCIP